MNEMKRMLSFVRRAVDDYNMIEDGDVIAIGISGGKDSLTLLEVLATMRMFYPKKYDIKAITVDMGFENADFSAVQDFCDKLGVAMLATRVDNKTGLFDGENCHGQEKVRRFYEVYPNGEVDEFYSDLYCDTPLARLAKKAYIVKGEKLTSWKKFK